MQQITINSAKIVLNKYPNCKFLLVGENSSRDAEYMNELKQMVKGYEDRIIFTGFRKDISEICAASDINLLISTDEGFGRVILEAGAMGVPTIGTNIGGIPEVIEDNKTGLLIPSEDSNKLTEAIIKLIENPSLRKKLGENAKERVKNKFSVEIHTRQIQNLYSSLLKTSF
jgi:glycosyltransferase involved in cell wall biosynthesis